MGENKFAVQFTESCERVANYLQQNAAAEGYLVAETVCSGREQTIKLLPPVDPNAKEKGQPGEHPRGNGEVGSQEASQSGRVAQEGICNGIQPVLPRGTGQAQSDKGLVQRV